MPKAPAGPTPVAPESAAMLGAPETTAMPAARRKVLPSDPDPVPAPPAKKED
jgi:hypothetical protein